MARRALRSPRWAIWGLCLVAGCLLRSPRGGALPAPPLPAGRTAPRDEAPPPPVPPPSDYGPCPVRPVAVLTPRDEAASPQPATKEQAPPAPAGKGEPPGLLFPPPAPAVEPPLMTALRSALDQRPQEARELLQAPHQSDRELLKALLRLAAEVGERELVKLSPEEVAAALEQVRRLHEQLRRRAALRLERVCFCRRIRGYGQYEPLPPDQAFRAGWEGRPGERVQVYAEVRHFATVCRQGQHETALATRLEVRDAGGRRVTALDLGACVDRCLSRREDYFLNIQFNVPAGLAPGLYTLWVVINDVGPAPPGQRALDRAAQRSLDFRVCPPGAGR